jgi:DNA-binding NarL/FixJ family response regulator
VTRIRVLLVDDNAGFRQRLARLLQMEQDMEIVGEAADGHEAIARARELQPDVVLMDFRMAGMDGVTAGRLLVREHPSVRVLILTAYPGALDREVLRRDGLAGLLIKDQPASEIAAAIRLPQAS